MKPLFFLGLLILCCAKEKPETISNKKIIGIIDSSEVTLSCGTYLSPVGDTEQKEIIFYHIDIEEYAKMSLDGYISKLEFKEHTDHDSTNYTLKFKILPSDEIGIGLVTINCT